MEPQQLTEAIRSVGRALVSDRGLRRVQAGHPWVYRSDIVEVPKAGAGVADVFDRGQRFVGQAFFSPASTITLRLLTRGHETIDREFFHRCLALSIERRRVLGSVDALRLVHGEADFLPGIFVDRYAEALALQTTCAAADALEPLLTELLVELTKPRVIVLRDDAASRAREGLRRHVTLAYGEPPATATYHEGDIAYDVDLLADHKTGSFLDQRENHLAAARYGRGRALDCFTYHGGFALQLARVCEHVLAVDSSEPALSRARDNAARARMANVTFEMANVFDLLPKLRAEERRFDTIVLDPPAFASSQATVEKALRAYKEINLRAMQLLTPGGILMTCSCSGRVTNSDFEEMLAQAGRDARRSVQILERRGAGPDHPILAGVPETEYLKCRIVCLA